MRRAVCSASRAAWCAAFTLSAGHRVLLRDGRVVPIIPRYLDLLLLLVAKRHEAVHRREILDTVWSDVVVSEGAVTQAVRALRRALDVAAAVLGALTQPFRTLVEEIILMPSRGKL